MNRAVFLYFTVVVAIMGTLLWTPNAKGLTDRKLWIFEQLLSPSRPTPKGSARYQTGIDFTNITDSLSLHSSGVIDFRLFEVRAHLSGRFHLQLSDEGRARRSSLSGMDQNLGLEIARHFTTQNRHYGRLGLVLFYFLPGHQNWFGFTLDTGILENATIPWAVSFHGSMLFNMGNQGKIVSAGTKSSRVLSSSSDSKLSLGGKFLWALHSRELTNPGAYEYMQFIVGPFLDWENTLGQFSFGINFRLWLNEEIAPSLTTHPSEYGAPGLHMTWSTFL